MMDVYDYGKVKLKTRERRHRVLLSAHNMFYSRCNDKNKVKYILRRKKQRLAPVDSP